MALPSGNLTAHFNASVDDDLWQTNTAGVFSDQSVDGDNVLWWDDVVHGAQAMKRLAVNTNWRSNTPLMRLPCIDFDGTGYMQLRDNADTTEQAVSTLITNSAFTVLVAFYAETIATNAAAAYDNDAIFAESGGFVGLHLKNAADPRLLFYNWSGAENTISLAINLNQSYVAMFRHEAGSIHASINGGTETSLTSGNTTTLTGNPRFGRGTTTACLNGRIGEFACWNAALTGSNLSSAIAHFMERWIDTPGTQLGQRAFILVPRIPVE